ncbi:MAG: hypothetical protein ACI9CV_000593 [Ilumatobacter sp.]
MRADDPKQQEWFVWVAEFVEDFAAEPIPIEVRRLGRPIAKWAHQITAWHRPHMTNGPTGGVNNRAKRNNER